MKITLFIGILLFFNPVFSQKLELREFDNNKKYTQAFIDSLIRDPEHAVKVSVYKKVLEKNNLMGWPHYYRGMASLVYREQKYDSTLYFAEKAIESYENAPVQRAIDEESLILAYFFKGKALRIKKNSFQAIEALQKALDLTKKYPYKWKAYINFDIANTHKSLGHNDIALNYHLANVNDSLFMTREAGSTFGSIGFLYQLMQKPDSALHYYNKSLNIYEEEEILDQQQRIYLRLGSLFQTQGLNESMNHYYSLAYETLKKREIDINDWSDPLTIETLIHYNKILLDQGQSSDVINDLPPLLDSLKAQTNGRYTKTELDLILFGQDYLVQAYLDEKEYFKAIEESQKKNDVLLTYTQQIQEEKIEELEIQYQTKEKEASILQLEESQEQQNVIINQQRIIAASLAGGLILLSILGFSFWRQRRLKNQYEKESLQQRLLRSQMNPHFVYNSLNFICALVEKKSSNTIPYINKLANLFRQVLANSREELVSLAEEISVLNNYLELQSNFSKKFHYDIQIAQDIHLEDIIIPPMIIQPFIENAIIHGLGNQEKTGKIEINIEKDRTQGLLICHIKDNGIGFSKGLKNKEIKSSKSISSVIVRDRLALFKKKFKVNSRFTIGENDQSGTHVQLFLPFFVDI